MAMWQPHKHGHALGHARERLQAGSNGWVVGKGAYSTTKWRTRAINNGGSKNDVITRSHGVNAAPPWCAPLAKFMR